jgi:hypothetical protein
MDHGDLQSIVDPRSLSMAVARWSSTGQALWLVGGHLEGQGKERKERRCRGGHVEHRAAMMRWRDGVKGHRQLELYPPVLWGAAHRRNSMGRERRGRATSTVFRMDSTRVEKGRQ